MSDERWMRAAARGDAEALAELVGSLGPDLYRYLAGMLGDEEEAASALQETFVRIARSAERFDGSEGVRRWTFRIARRVASDARPTPSAHPGRFPEESSDEVAWARRALRALPLEAREILVVRELLSWEAETIEDVLAIPASEVPDRLTEARRDLLTPALWTGARSEEAPTGAADE